MAIRVSGSVFDIRGEVFGTWTVLDLPYIRRNRHTFWNCRCTCGVERQIDGNILRSGRSLGCFACGRKKLEASAFLAYFRQLQYGAIQRGHEFSVSMDYLIALLAEQNYVCALSGMPIEIAATQRLHKHGSSTASLDRMDSGIGYVVGNVQWVHKDINFIKQEYSQEYFVSLCQAVVKKMQVPAKPKGIACETVNKAKAS
jgi:hypothetical protein